MTIAPAIIRANPGDVRAAAIPESIEGMALASDRTDWFVPSARPWSLSDAWFETSV